MAGRPRQPFCPKCLAEGIEKDKVKNSGYCLEHRRAVQKQTRSKQVMLNKDSKPETVAQYLSQVPIEVVREALRLLGLNIEEPEQVLRKAEWVEPESVKSVPVITVPAKQAEPVVTVPVETTKPSTPVGRPRQPFCPDCVRAKVSRPKVKAAKDAYCIDHRKARNKAYSLGQKNQYLNALNAGMQWVGVENDTQQPVEDMGGSGSTGSSSGPEAQVVVSTKPDYSDVPIDQVPIPTWESVRDGIEELFRSGAIDDIDSARQLIDESELPDELKPVKSQYESLIRTGRFGPRPDSSESDGHEGEAEPEIDFDPLERYAFESQEASEAEAEYDAPTEEPTTEQLQARAQEFNAQLLGPPDPQ